VCAEERVTLIVDEAHGAHFGLHPSMPASAMQQGADVAIQSTHKMLTAMTQAAMLHVRCGSSVDATRVSRSLQMLQVGESICHGVQMSSNVATTHGYCALSNPMTLSNDGTVRWCV
jgi:hypothetical protein